jgi:hypothetical protein
MTMKEKTTINYKMKFAGLRTGMFPIFTAKKLGPDASIRPAPQLSWFFPL